MVPHRLLVEVGIASIARAVEHHLRELQHVVRVARLGAVQLVDVSVGILSGQEVLVDRVAADADGAVRGHVLPEVLGRLEVVGGRGVFLPDALHADVLRHLRVGVFAVEEGRRERLHALEHRPVGVFLRCVEVFLVAEELVGVEHRLVHAAVLRVEHALHVGVAQLRHYVDAPVGELAEQLAGHLALAVDVGIAQSGQNLVLHVEGHPSAVALVGLYVTLVEGRPVRVDGLSADESVESLGVLVELVLTVLHHLQHVVHALLQTGLQVGVVTGGIGQGQGRQIVAADVAAEVEAGVAPVGEVRVARGPLVVRRLLVRRLGQSGLAHVGRQQAVDVVFHEHLDVLVHGCLHRTVEQCHLLQVEVFGIEQALGRCADAHREHGKE